MWRSLELFHIVTIVKLGKYWRWKILLSSVMWIVLSESELLAMKNLRNLYSIQHRSTSIAWAGNWAECSPRHPPLVYRPKIFMSREAAKNVYLLCPHPLELNGHRNFYFQISYFFLNGQALTPPPFRGWATTK